MTHRLLKHLFAPERHSAALAVPGLFTAFWLLAYAANAPTPQSGLPPGSRSI